MSHAKRLRQRRRAPPFFNFERTTYACNSSRVYSTTDPSLAFCFYPRHYPYP
nr:MAG TPA: hypothetical protein [Caudoviricetes sp.]